jgi:predicted enzyme related to lactoylglutathione lyase
LILTRYLHRPCPTPGSAWTGFVVADIEATLAALERAGGRIEVPIHAPDTHSVKAALASDPEGHMIEIIQMTGAD